MSTTDDEVVDEIEEHPLHRYWPDGAVYGQDVEVGAHYWAVWWKKRAPAGAPPIFPEIGYARALAMEKGGAGPHYVQLEVRGIGRVGVHLCPGNQVLVFPEKAASPSWYALRNVVTVSQRDLEVTYHQVQTYFQDILQRVERNLDLERSTQVMRDLVEICCTKVPNTPSGGEHGA